MGQSAPKNNLKEERLILTHAFNSVIWLYSDSGKREERETSYIVLKCIFVNLLPVTPRYQLQFLPLSPSDSAFDYELIHG